MIEAKWISRNYLHPTCKYKEILMLKVRSRIVRGKFIVT